MQLICKHDYFIVNNKTKRTIIPKDLISIDQFSDWYNLNQHCFTNYNLLLHSTGGCRTTKKQTNSSTTHLWKQRFKEKRIGNIRVKDSEHFWGLERTDEFVFCLFSLCLSLCWICGPFCSCSNRRTPKPHPLKLEWHLKCHLSLIWILEWRAVHFLPFGLIGKWTDS